MLWTILIVLAGIVLFLLGAVLGGSDAKKPAFGLIFTTAIIKLVAVVLLAAGVCRLYAPALTKNYLLNKNPAIIYEMVKAAELQKQEEAAKAVKAYLKEHTDEMIADAPVWGKQDAKKTIFLFSDYSCPYCRRVHNELASIMAMRDDVRVVLKNFSVHGEMSDIPARAVIAAKLQGNDKAAALDKALMEKGYFKPEDMKDRAKLPAKAKKNVMALAAEVGLDVAQLEKDMNGAVVARELNNVYQFTGEFEVGGTPYLIVEGNVFPGYVPASKITEALDK